MTTTTADPGLKPCDCGCGELVKGRFKRGHYLRDQKNRLDKLPGPDDELDGAEPADAGEAIPEGGPPGPRADVAEGADEDVEIPADKPAGRLKEKSGKPSPKAKVRVTAGLRKDVHAKIRFVLLPAGQAWQARDPLCGGTFVAQEPDISDALADIVCDSPDLLAWFTGPAGGFMKYFRLAMALQPVGISLWLHHIAHSELAAGDPQQHQMPAYAA
jgi:hypothetical protein